MKLFKKNALLLILFCSSFFVYGQYTEEQKIDLDNINRLTEPALVLTQDHPLYSYNADIVVEVGDGTTYGTAPSLYGDWSNYWENVHTQTLYLASEIGGSMLITDLQYSFERIASSPNNSLSNVQIRFLETTDNVLTTGSFYDMTASTLVWSSANYVPATVTGWANLIDIDDYAYSGTKNIIVDILWGDNGYWTSTYYRTHKTVGGATRMLVGYADSQTPPSYDGASSFYSNIRFYGSRATVPVSFWVIFASIFLIGISIFVRYRKRIA